MKGKIMFLFLSIILTNVAISQRHKKYIAIVTAQDGVKTKGLLQSVNDSTLILLKGKEERNFSIRSIKLLKVRRSSAFGKGMLKGACGGAVLGFIIGYIAHENTPRDSPAFYFDIGPEFSGIVGALIGGTSGMLLVGGAATVGKKYVIDQPLLAEDVKIELQKLSLALEK